MQLLSCEFQTAYSRESWQ